MGGVFSRSKSQVSYMGMPTVQTITRPSAGAYVYAIFLIVLSLGLLGISAVSLAYIEETKDSITDRNISQAMIQTSEAGTALALIVSIIMLISSAIYFSALRKA